MPELREILLLCVLSVLRFTDSDYLFGIFKLLSHKPLNIKLNHYHQGVTNSTSFIYGNQNGEYLIGQYYNVTVYNINKNIDIKRSAHDTFLE
jgi:hypothetical protein